jgi:hypothetical protein
MVVALLVWLAVSVGFVLGAAWSAASAVSVRV